MDQVTRKLSCIVCPMGCLGEVTIENGEVTAASGFTCPRGEKYAREEVKAPKRTLTTTVRISGADLPLLPVISKRALPKDRVMECARFLTGVEVNAPIKEGDIICPNILGLGVDIVAARDLN